MKDAISLCGKDGEITTLLQAWSGGDPYFQEQLFDTVYPELRRLADQRVRREGDGISIQATELANEAYLRLLRQERTAWRNRRHFWAVVAILIRRILVDRARLHRRQKRGAGAIRVCLDEDLLMHSVTRLDMLELEHALQQLAMVSVTAERVVELRFFAGLSVSETAEALSLGRQTVVRRWRFARAFLADRLTRGQ